MGSDLKRSFSVLGIAFSEMGGEEGGLVGWCFRLFFHFSLIGREERVGIWAGLGWGP